MFLAIYLILFFERMNHDEDFSWLAFRLAKRLPASHSKVEKIDTDPNPIDSHSFALKPHPKAVGRQGEAFTDKIVLNLDAMEVQDMDSRVYSEVMGRWRRDAIHDLYEKNFWIHTTIVFWQHSKYKY